MSTTPVPSVIPPVVPTATTSATSVTPSSSPTSTTPTSATPVTPTTSSPVSTSPASTGSSSSSSSLSSSSTSVPPSTTSSSTTGTTSSTSTTTTSLTSQSSSSFSSISYVLQTSDGQVYTLTSFVTESSSPTQPPTSSSSSNNGFIHNKGAVAGVFSVVGVCTVVLAFFLFTSYLRRRRAREFDREIEEAAAAAATARPPDFDDYDYGSAAGGYGHYSETSHGTLSQAPLSHDPRNDQSRSQEGSHDPYPGAGVSGAAGIGARGRSVRNGGQQDPYAALSNPPEQYEMHETGRTWQQGTPLVGPGGTSFDILQAAGLSSSDPYAVTRGPSTRTGLTYGQNQSGTSGLTRSQSQGTSALPTTVAGYPMPVPTPAPVYPGAQDTAYVPNEKARYSASYAPGAGVSTMPPDVDEDAYDGYQEQPSAALNNPHSPGFAVPRAGEGADEEQNVRAPYSQEREEAARVSLADDEDYGYTVGQRVLRVANE